MPESQVRLAPLPDLAAISVAGSDAASFLSAQLSQTPPKPGAAHAPLAAWADAKGRVQALFRLVYRDDGYLLITHGSIVDAVSTSLRRYVLRAAVTIDVAADTACAALLGESAAWLAERGIELDLEAGAVAPEGDAMWLRLGPQLVHVLAARDTIEQLAATLPNGPADDAELAEIRLGLPSVSAPLRGKFLPQMLNLDVLGGVAFDKGCYPGQEVIARAQHRGTIKRRLAHFRCEPGEFAPAPGERVADRDGNHVGHIVRAAPTADGSELLAVVELAAMGRQLRLKVAELQTLSPA